MTRQPAPDEHRAQARGRSQAARLIRGTGVSAVIAALLPLAASCVQQPTDFVGLPIETRLSFLNLSQTYYVAFGIREHGDGTTARPFTYSPLLAPGATAREDILSFLDTRCPASFDLQVLLYRRVNSGIPIGLDTGEQVGAIPIAAGQVENVPACSVETLETYTIANWEAPEGIARVKVAQCSSVDEAIRASGLFGSAEGVWQVEGVDPALAGTAPPALAENGAINGKVIGRDGRGIAGIGVLIRSRYRIQLDCANSTNPDDAGYSDPIDFTGTDADGAFELQRPPGAYEIEFFSDDYVFRPGVMEVETPLDAITIVAEPL